MKISFGITENAQMSQGGEWVRVRVSGNVRKTWHECLFRLRVKGYRSLRCLRRSIDLLLSIEKWNAIIIKPCKHKSDAHISQGEWAQASLWSSVWMDSVEWMSGSVVEREPGSSFKSRALHAWSRLLVLEWLCNESMVVVLYVDACKLDLPSGGW